MKTDQEEEKKLIDKTKPIVEMSTQNILKTPEFISDTKSFASYERDLRRWSRLTSLPKKQQAEWILLHLEGHPSGIKEKIETNIGDKLEDNENGIEDLIVFLKSIYQVDELADSFTKYMKFEKLQRAKNVPVQTFIAKWESAYMKMKKTGCELADMVMAYKLLHSCNLTDMEVKLVLTGVNYQEGMEKKNLFEQTKEGLKKFVGRSVIGASEEVKEESTYVTREELVLWMNQNKKKGRRRSQSAPEDEGKKSGPKSSAGYKGRKNPLGSDFLPLKCFKCKCECKTNCNCKCRYHLLAECPDRKKETKTPTPDTALFVGVTTPAWGPGQEDEVFVAEELDNLVAVAEGEGQEGPLALVDSACPRTVGGVRTVEAYLGGLPEVTREAVVKTPSDRVFKFGGGERRKSLFRVDLPCSVAGRRDIRIRTEVVEADIPLLLGNTTLTKANVSLHFGTRKASVLGLEVDLRETASGHFSLQLEQPVGSREDKIGLEEDKVFSVEEVLDRAKVDKLHHYFGHCAREKLEKLVQRAGRMTDEVKGYIREVYESCEACNVIGNRRPKPAAVIPKACALNDVVTIDLKEYGEGALKYIVYAVDRFSRLTVGQFVSDKRPVTIGQFLLQKWIAVFGRMKVLHSDRGGEFVNEELTRLAEYLDVRLSHTAASSPNQNGCNERNHAVVDRVMQKMLFQEPGMKPEIALCWALSAKNCLENWQGFSPAQLVFGVNPGLPAIYCSGPPGMEEARVSGAMWQHINAMHLAREMYIQCENDTALKTALRKRCFKSAEMVNIGEWIYFKNARAWEGPVKVVSKDGKLLYVVRAGRLLTINSDHAVVSKCGEVRPVKSFEPAGGLVAPGDPAEGREVRPGGSGPGAGVEWQQGGAALAGGGD